MPRLVGADPKPDRQVRLARPGRSEEHDVFAAGDEVERAEVGDLVATWTEMTNAQRSFWATQVEGMYSKFGDQEHQPT